MIEKNNAVNLMFDISNESILHIELTTAMNLLLG